MSFRFLLLSVLMATATAASGQASDPARIEFFEKQIRPLLVEHCVVCHGPRLQQGGLRLDSAEFLRQGGQSGPAVVPGKVEESRLIQLVRGSGDLQMPPTGPLSESEVAALEQWVRAGAVWPQPRAVRKQEGERQGGVVARPPRRRGMGGRVAGLAEGRRHPAQGRRDPPGLAGRQRPRQPLEGSRRGGAAGRGPGAGMDCRQRGARQAGPEIRRAKPAGGSRHPPRQGFGSCPDRLGGGPV